jgi:hypothetical protein
MESSLDFATYTQWSIYATVGFFVLALLGFIWKWGIRFRLVGAAGFMVVLTVGLFGLSLGLFSHKTIPGAIGYSLVYDNGANQAVIVVPETITKSELEATLQQAAEDLFSYGRAAIGSNDKLTIRARVLIHPQDDRTKPVYIGQAQRNLGDKDNTNIDIQIFADRLAQLQLPPAKESNHE